MKQERVTIGKIVAPHGVRGDVRILPLTDMPNRFNRLKTVYLDDGRLLEVTAAKSHKQTIILKFAGLEDRNAVEALKGRLLQVDRADAAPLPQGHYYVFDLLGLTVEEENGLVLGKVADVLKTGANDVYVIAGDNGKEILIPAIKEVVRRISLEEGRMVVKLQEEWSGEDED